MDIQAEYDRLLVEAEACGAPEPFLRLSRRCAKDAIWKHYDWLLSLVPRPLTGAVAVDIGCKYGHALPLFLARGASRAIGIDVEDDYVATGRRMFGTPYPNIEFQRSDDGFLSMPPESVDVVLLNEVISHVNPMYLENLYAEIARTLKRGGYVIISDGNNIANADCRRDLLGVYDAWENGPDGRDTGRDIVKEPFCQRRRDIIHARHPDLPPHEVEYVARNTSGLFGTFFLAVVDDYVRTGRLIERPFRPGIFPTNPRASGVVMERGFHPQHVELTLATYGIRAHQMTHGPRFQRNGLRGTLVNAYRVLRHKVRCRLWPDGYRGSSWGFQILGVKDR